MAVKRIIGIDFGTSTSVMKVKRYNDNNGVLTPVNAAERTAALPVTFDNSPTVPTLIRDYNGTYYMGQDAAKMEKKGSILYRDFKMDLESKNEKKRITAKEHTSAFIEYMYKRYKEMSDGGIFGAAEDREECVISYPVKWKSETRDFMINAARNAGFENVRGMDEATAAICAVTMLIPNVFTKQSSGKPMNVLLIDMGAGTTDLVMCRCTIDKGIKNEIICTYPSADSNITFGGTEADDKLARYILSKTPDEEWLKDKCRKFLDQNIEKVKSWKEYTVSELLQQNDTVDDCGFFEQWLSYQTDEYMEALNLNRQTFGEYAGGYIAGLRELVSGCIKTAGMQPSDVDFVITTGGHSQWYFVDEVINGIDGLNKIQSDSKRILHLTVPQETVAFGLVLNPLLNCPDISESVQQEPTLPEQEQQLQQENTQSKTEQQPRQDILIPHKSPVIDDNFDYGRYVEDYVYNSSYYRRYRDKYCELDEEMLRRSFETDKYGNQTIIFGYAKTTGIRTDDQGHTIFKSGWLLTDKGMFVKSSSNLKELLGVDVKFREWKKIINQLMTRRQVDAGIGAGAGAGVLFFGANLVALPLVLAVMAVIFGVNAIRGFEGYGRDTNVFIKNLTADLAYNHELYLANAKKENNT